MATTYWEGTGDGSDLTWPFSFKSYQESDVKVRLNDILVTNYTIASYTTTGGGTVTFNNTGVNSDVCESNGAPKSGVRIFIHRDTDVDTAKADFQAGASLKADDLDNNQTQVLYHAQEQQNQPIQTNQLRDSSVTTAKIADATIINADISATAEIAVSKLADGAARQVLQTAADGTTVEWTNNVDLPGTLDVTGAADFDSTVNVDGTATLATVDINAGAIDGTTIGGSSAAAGTFTNGTIATADINGGAIDGTTIGANSAAAGTFTTVDASGAVGVDGNFDVNTNKFTVAAATGNTVVAGNLDVAGQFDVTGTSNYTGQQTVPGGALVKNIEVGLDADNEVSTSSGNLILDSAGGTVQITDHLNVTGNADVDGNLNVDGTLVVDSTSTLTGAVTASGGVTGDVTGDVTGTATNATHVTLTDNENTNENNVIPFVEDAQATGNRGLETDGDFHYNPSTGRVTATTFTGTLTGNVTGDVTGNADTATDLVGAAKITNSEHAAHTATDDTYYTTSASDARYFNIDSGEEIRSGETWSADDAKIATTLAIDNRIVDLIDEVGGFVALDSEAAIPAAHPEAANATTADRVGTIISIKELSATYTPSSGTCTIPSGTLTNHSNAATITGCGSTTLSSGFGILIETTAQTDAQYTAGPSFKFHRLVPKATEVTTVASKATEIGRLGTAAAVEDLGILGTTAVVADMDLLGTSACVADMALLGDSAVIADMATIADTSNLITNIGTVAGIQANVTTVAGVSANVTTVATNISDVNNFADLYQIASSAPSTDGGSNSLAAGDLYFDTSGNELKVYNGSSWQAGVTATGNLVSKSGDVMTGNLTMGEDAVIIFEGATDNAHEITLTVTDPTADRTITLPNVTGTVVTTGDTGTVTATMLAANSVDSSELVDGSVDLSHMSSNSVDSNQYVDGSIDTAHIGDDQVTLAKMAGLARGKIIVGDSSGNPAALTAGSNDQVLTMDANGDVGWEAPAAGGIASLVADTSPQLGGDLDTNSFEILLDDDHKIKFGASDDLQIYHDSGGNSFIKETGSGSFIINADDFYLQDVATNTQIKSVSGGAVELYHNGTKKFETTSAGVKISGSGSDAVELEGDVWFNNNEHAGADIYFNSGDKHLIFEDNVIAKFGGGGDLQIYHDTSHSYITEGGTGSLLVGSSAISLTNAANTETFLYATANGKVQLRYDDSTKLETTSTGISVTGKIEVSDDLDLTGASYNALWDKSANTLKFNDSAKVTLGTGADVTFYHDGSNTFLNSGTGYLLINNTASTSTILRGASDVFMQTAGGEQGVIARANGAAELYYDNSKKFETTSGGASVTGQLAVSDSVKFVDHSSSTTGMAIFGADSDMKIYHNNTKGAIQNSTGELLFRTDGFRVKNEADDETFFVCNNNGSLALFFDNSLKFETNSDGVILGDSKKLCLGSDSDAKFYDTGSKLWLDVFNNHDFGIALGAGNENSATFASNGPVDLYYDNSLKCKTTSTGVQVDTYITLGGTGGIRSDSAIVIEDAGGNEWRAKFHDNAQCEFAYDNAKKLETISTGVNITGGIRVGGNNAANELDDYEEGTWTPNFVGHSTNGSGTYSSVGGWYVKVGRQVTAGGYGSWTDHSGAGTMRINNLPFSRKSGDGYAQAGSVMVTNWNYNADETAVCYAESGTELYFMQIYDNESWEGMQVDTNAACMFCVSYWTDS